MTERPINFIPGKVVVSGLTYEVRITKDDNKRQGQGDYGVSDHRFLYITIADDQHPLQAGNTFLHEILHCIAYAYDINFKVDPEERVVTKFANGLFGVFKENPAILNYLQTILKTEIPSDHT